MNEQEILTYLTALGYTTYTVCPENEIINEDGQLLAIWDEENLNYISLVSLSHK